MTGWCRQSLTGQLSCGTGECAEGGGLGQGLKTLRDRRGDLCTWQPLMQQLQPVEVYCRDYTSRSGCREGAWLQRARPLGQDYSKDRHIQGVAIQAVAFGGIVIWGMAKGIGGCGGILISWTLA